MAFKGVACVVLVLLLAATAAASLAEDHAVFVLPTDSAGAGERWSAGKPAQVEGEEGVCCNDCGVCTKSIPPLCTCFDVVQECPPWCSNCNNVLLGKVCTDVKVNYCEHSCVPSLPTAPPPPRRSPPPPPRQSPPPPPRWSPPPPPRRSPPPPLRSPPPPPRRSPPPPPRRSPPPPPRRSPPPPPRRSPPPPPRRSPPPPPRRSPPPPPRRSPPPPPRRSPPPPRRPPARAPPALFKCMDEMVECPPWSNYCKNSCDAYDGVIRTVV